MDKQQARQIITKTFESSFDKDRFTGFIKNLLNRIDKGSFIYKGNYIPDAYKQYIKSLERIGKFSDGEYSLDILVITLKKETSLERARTMQRNFIAWYLNGSRGGEMKDAALVAYVSPEQSDWRFSLVKIDYKFEKGKSGKIKVKEEFTPARRWSFLVGANEKSHTAQSRLVNILANDEQAPTLAELENAFDIETVTKEFFFKYRELFLCTKETLDKAVKNDPKVKVDFESKGVDTVNFAKKLLGQIVFLYFLQKKGWFGVGRDDDWGTGSKHFLRKLFEGAHGGYKNFFNDILEPLFYEALRIDRSHDDDYYSRFNCKIPFLDGGLFDPIGNYDWVHTDINLTNDLFSNSRQTREGDTGDGILDVFDRYNFTVREDEPLEKEVAIDPELLGKAYEKFNAIRPDNFDEFTKALKSGKKGEENKFNKKFGVYYTPREIVHYMCRQSLINYLLTQADEAGLSSAINKQDMEDLIEVGELITEHEATALIKQENIRNGLQKYTEYTALLSDSIRENAAAIDKWLEDITVCDPAVGSGAFPVGMMNEIVRARNVLTVFLKNKQRNDYEFKRRCIVHSLYGVDIDPGAVEIAKLRLWLSLVVDEEDIKNIRPLPNLDYKIVCGNSLLGVEKDLFNYQLFNDLEKLKPLYFMETNPTKKQEYKKQIDNLISQITSGHTEFDFEVFFSEVFHNKGGFDVVIANPPYGAIMSSYFNRINREIKNNIEEMKDIYKAFFIHGISCLLKANGNLVFITPNTYYFQKKYIDLRRYLKKYNHKIHINIGDGVFDSVVPTAISIVQKSKIDTYYEYYDLSQENISQGSFARLLAKNIVLCKQNEINADNSFEILPPIRMSHENVLALDKIVECRDAGIQYTSNVTKVKKAKMKPLVERIFYQDDNCQKQNAKDFNLLIGKNIDRYHVDLNCTNFLRSNYREKPLKKCEERVWFSRDILECNERIIWRQTADKIIAAYDTSGYYFKKSVHCGILRTEFRDSIHYFYLLALLNSKYLNHLYVKLSHEKGRIFAQIKLNKIRQLPIINIDRNEQQPFVILVDKILAITKDDDYFQNPDKQAQAKGYGDQIDQMVYELYGLTDEEIKIVEGETG